MEIYAKMWIIRAENEKIPLEHCVIMVNTIVEVMQRKSVTLLKSLSFPSVVSKENTGSSMSTETISPWTEATIVVSKKCDLIQEKSFLEYL